MKTLFLSLILIAGLGSVHVAAETAFFLMNGPPGLGDALEGESYVIAVSDPALIEEARNYLGTRMDGGPPYLVPRVKIAAGADGINRNHARLDRRLWNWHVAELASWQLHDPSIGPMVVLPPFYNSPSSVGKYFAQNPNAAPIELSLQHYPLAMELLEGVKTNVINVSTRGWVGSGERALITGFVVQGGAPRSVVIRAIGPSLKNFGLNDVLANPRLAVFRGSEMIAVNDDWKDGNFTPPVEAAVIPPPPPPWYAWLFPADDKESAIHLSLPPGAYTVHVSSVDGSPGVGLVDVSDLDAMKPK